MIKYILCLSISLFLVSANLLMPATSLAAEFRSGEVMNFGAGAVLNNAYVAANQLEIKGSQIERDLVAAADQATIEAEIKGGLIAAARELNLKGAVGQNAR